MKHVVNYSSFALNEARSIFNKEGLLHIVNTGMKSLNEMNTVADLFIEKPMTYDGGANNRNILVGNVYDVGAPLDADIMYHHEMSYAYKTPSKIAFCVEKIPKHKGWTYVSDQLKLTEELLKTDFGKNIV